MQAPDCTLVRAPSPCLTMACQTMCRHRRCAAAWRVESSCAETGGRHGEKVAEIKHRRAGGGRRRRVRRRERAGRCDAVTSREAVLRSATTTGRLHTRSTGAHRLALRCIPRPLGGNPPLGCPLLLSVHLAVDVVQNGLRRLFYDFSFLSTPRCLASLEYFSFGTYGALFV